MLPKCHTSCLSSFFLENSLYFGVNEIISFHKLVGNLDKMTVVNLGRQHLISLDSYFKSSWEYLYLNGVISYCSIPPILLKLAIYIKLILLKFLYSLYNLTFCVFPKCVTLKRENNMKVVEANMRWRY